GRARGENAYCKEAVSGVTGDGADQKQQRYGNQGQSRPGISPGSKWTLKIWGCAPQDQQRNVCRRIIGDEKDCGNSNDPLEPACYHQQYGGKRGQQKSSAWSSACAY